MQYRHAYHAGNFADVHKHVLLLALVAAMQRKEKGFLYLETHAGRGAYDLREREPAKSGEARHGVERLLDDDGAQLHEPEIRAYVEEIRDVRRGLGPHAYPGSPLLASRRLRLQDRAVCVESQPPEARALARSLASEPRAKVEQGDGFERLRALLPPPERRALVLIDPPYEEERELAHATEALLQALARFASAVLAMWLPVKRARELASWRTGLAPRLAAPALLSQLWVHPRDSAVALNGSGMLIVNPPWQIDARMQAWLPPLQRALDPRQEGGMEIEWLREPT